MQNLSKLATALLVGAMMSASALAAGNAFVTVNGVAVSQNLANVFMAEQKAQGAPAVSYTHLDVYKRQTLRAGPNGDQPPKEP